MPVFDQVGELGHEEVIFVSDAASDLRAIIAIHSTKLGPALGGTRWYPYASEDEALHDVLRLSSAMTAKAAVAGLDVGGGKAVVIGDPAAKSDAQLVAYGRAIERLGGRYITTTDVGTTTAEMDRLRDVTRFVVGLSVERGGGGDTSALTARTIVSGMRAALSVAAGDERLAGRHVVVLGVGKVGARVAREVA
ncbi:MAG: valine dehydrogenase, partial [Chloroflexi bacterium]|nr:valine dehydrogenase [Chloroflexota bacterium]